MKNNHLTKGFTLLELLIAIAIFSVMAVMIFGGFRLVVDGKLQLEEAADSLSSLQRSFLFIQQDIEQAVSRSIRDEFGSQEAAFICCTDEKLLQITRGGIRGVITGGSDLKRVEYRLKEGNLQRIVWPTLDRVQDVRPSRLHLMDSVQGFEIDILSYDDSEWNGSISTEMEGYISAVPRAVKVTITTEKYGVVSRLFVIGP